MTHGQQTGCPGFDRGGEASPGFCLQVSRTLARVSAEPAHLHHLHTAAMTFSMFFDFSGCKAWPVEPLTGWDCLPTVHASPTSQNKSQQVKLPLPFSVECWHFRRDPGWSQRRTNRGGLWKEKGCSLHPPLLGIRTCYALVAKLNPWQWLTPAGSGSGGVPVAPQPVM